MPGRGASNIGRKKPFSSKQKKEQLQCKNKQIREFGTLSERRNREDDRLTQMYDNLRYTDGFHKSGVIKHSKNTRNNSQASSSTRHGKSKSRLMERGEQDDYTSEKYGDATFAEVKNSSGKRRPTNLNVQLQKINYQPPGKSAKGGFDSNRYRLHLIKESDEQLYAQKILSMKAYQRLSNDALELDPESIYCSGSSLDMPKRPSWKKGISKEQLLAKEEQYFQSYVENILSEFGEQGISYFELNLETWRQLWRVVEMADILLIIADIRHPALHFSTSLYHHVVDELQKPVVLVLNKIDMVPASLVVAWQAFFKEKFPELHVICFTSFPRTEFDDTCGKSSQKRKKKTQLQALGARELLNICQRIVKDQVNLSSWFNKIEEVVKGTDTSEETEVVYHEDLGKPDNEYKRFKDGILTIGCIGYPNVGKSSLINGLVGNKVVSVSATPGHTKHFQTYFLTKSVQLCDCPGLVFPSLIPKPMQVIAGIYPVAQVREPYSIIQFIAERIDLPEILHLKKNEDDGDEAWSAFTICQAWAEFRGYLTGRNGRPDTHRAANHLLRKVMSGELVMYFRPPNYSQSVDIWENHPQFRHVRELQKFHLKSLREMQQLEENEDFSENEEDEEDEVVLNRNIFCVLDDEK